MLIVGSLAEDWQSSFPREKFNMKDVEASVGETDGKVNMKDVVDFL